MSFLPHPSLCLRLSVSLAAPQACNLMVSIISIPPSLSPSVFLFLSLFCYLGFAATPPAHPCVLTEDSTGETGNKLIWTGGAADFLQCWRLSRSGAELLSTKSPLVHEGKNYTPRYMSILVEEMERITGKVGCRGKYVVIAGMDDGTIRVLLFDTWERKWTFVGELLLLLTLHCMSLNVLIHFGGMLYLLACMMRPLLMSGDARSKVDCRLMA